MDFPARTLFFFFPRCTKSSRKDFYWQFYQKRSKASSIIGMLLWNILWPQWNHVLNSQLITSSSFIAIAIVFALCPFFAPDYAFYRDFSIEHYVNAINLLYEIFIMYRSLFSEARKLHVWFPLIFSRSWIVNQSKRLIFQVLSLLWNDLQSFI